MDFIMFIWSYKELLLKGIYGNRKKVGNIDKAISINGWIMQVWQDIFPMHMFLLQTKPKMSQFYQHSLA